jgi:hypothetical protein
MSEKTTINPYEAAIEKLRPHISRAGDGTFAINVADGSALGIDPIIFADLRRSMEHTNEMIRRGVIKPEDVEWA